MSCLLPQYKCVPDTFSFHCKKPITHISKSRELFYFRTQCSVSTVSPPVSTSTTTRLDLEKLRLLFVETRANSAPTERPWMHIGPFDSPNEAKLGANLPTETLLTSEEAIIATAAAEALVLAKAALKVAKDAAKLMGSTNLYENSANLSTKSDTMLNDKAQLTQIGKFDFNDILPLDNPISEADEALALAEVALRVSKYAAKLMGSINSNKKYVNLSTELDISTEIGNTGFKENFLLKNPISGTDDLGPTREELELLEVQLASSKAVRSNRQMERKARRMRAAEKAAASVVSVKSGSTSRKKRVAFQEIDRSDPLRFLRATTGSSRLLTATEEQEFSIGIQNLLKLERLQEELAERCGCEPTFAQWAAAAGVDQKVLRERLSYGTLCKDKMIKSNLRLVISIAKNYQGSGMNLQDLVQEGCRGLVRGAEKFDASKGFKFSTYAHWWIKQAVRRFLSDQSRTIRLPFHMVEATYRVKEARKQLVSETGRQPNDEEIAEATGLSMKRLQAVLLAPKPPRSLDQKVGIDQDLKPSEVTADPEAETSEEILIKQFMKKDLEKVLDSLNPREKQVIRWRFGLDDGRMKALQEIGELMGVSRERVRQIESCAFRKLKNKRKTKHLQQYLVA